MPEWRARAQALGLVRERMALRPPRPLDPLTGEQVRVPRVPAPDLPPNEIRSQKRAPALPKLAGQAFGSDAAADPEEMREAKARLERLATWFRGGDDEESAGLFETRAVTGREVLAGTSFALTEGTAESGLAGLWGRGAVTRFDGREGDLTLDGEVESALLGAELWPRVGDGLREGGGVSWGGDEASRSPSKE